jgi:hypothetical protein
LFGSEISVAVQPMDHARVFHGYPGGRGLTAQHLGTRGYSLTITGTLWASGASYSVARAALYAALAAVEDMQYWAAADYTHLGETYYQLVFGPMRIVPIGEHGRTVIWTNGWCGLRFTMQARSMF